MRHASARPLPNAAGALLEYYRTLLDGYVNGLFILAGKIKHITYQPCARESNVDSGRLRLGIPTGAL